MIRLSTVTSLPEGLLTPSASWKREAIGFERGRGIPADMDLHRSESVLMSKDRLFGRLVDLLEPGTRVL